MKNRESLNCMVAVILIFSVLFSQFVFSPVVVGAITDAEEIKYWDGSTADNYAGSGDGSKDDPYLIENAAQLYKMVKENYTDVTNGTLATPKYFKIIKDIYINNVTDADLNAPTVDAWNAKGFKNWNIGYSWTDKSGFCGNVDGDGHTIYGLYVSSGQYSGLFPVVAESANISNLNLKNSFVRQASNGGSAAGIIGVVLGGTDVASTANVSNCMVDNCYIASEDKGSWRCGAIVGGGYNEGKITVKNCAVTRVTMTVANPDTVDRSCAFIGNTNKYSGHEIINCYTDASTHPVTNAKDGGKNTGISHYDTIHKSKVFKNVYTSASKPDYYDDLADKYKDVIIYLEDDQMKGEAAKTNMSALNYSVIWKIVDNNYPILNPNTIEVWGGKPADITAIQYAGGDGSKGNPYQIENGDQLYKMVAENTKYKEADVATVEVKYFKIIKDICLNAASANDLTKFNTTTWKNTYNQWYYAPTAQDTGFSGVVDGGGHTVYGVYHNGLVSDAAMSGLIPNVIGKAEITNLNLRDSFCYGKVSGGIVGLVAGKDTKLIISRCTLADSRIQGWGSSERVGGIVGGTWTNSAAKQININISYCSVTRISFVCNMKSQGGIIGYGYTSTTKDYFVKNCFTDETAFPGNYSANSKYATQSKANITFENVYTTAQLIDEYEGIIKVDNANAIGDHAKTNMSGLCFECGWQTVKGDYPTPVVYVKPNNIWDGTVAENYANSDTADGSEENPYTIENGAQLYKMVKENYTDVTDGALVTPKYFKITKDIYLNDVCTCDLYKSTVNAWDAKGFKNWYIGYSWTNSSGFYGNVDGDGHTIYGLYVSSGQYSGLFPVVAESANISNLNLKNSFVRQASPGGSAAGIIGVVFGGTDVASTANVSNCMVDNCYIASDDTGSWRCGAIVGGGYNEGKITVTNCAVTRVTMTVANTQTPGRSCAFIGNTSNSGHKITNCYTDSSTHPVTNAITIDNQTGENHYDIIHKNKVFTNVYTSASKPEYYDDLADKYKDVIIYLEDEQMKGDNAKVYMSGLPFGFDWVVVENGYPLPVKNAIEIWDGTTATEYANSDTADGSKENPYIIENGAQLLKMVKENTASTSDAEFAKPNHFKITKDIYLNKVTEADMNNPTVDSWDANNFKEWNSGYNGSPTKGFCGVVDGGNHIIYGLYSKSGSYGGLFANVADSADISNIILKNSFVQATDSPGGIIGRVSGQENNRSTANLYGCIVDNCYIYATAGWRIGAIVGGGDKEGVISVNQCAVLNIKMKTDQSGSPNRTCAFIGNTNYSTHEVTNCYTDSSTHPVTNAITIDNQTGEYHYDIIHKNKVFTNVYTSASKPEYYDNLADKYKGVITYLSDAQMKGDNAKTYMPGLDYYFTWETVANSYPVFKNDASIEFWGGKVADTATIEYAGGNGTKASPYKIANGDQLYKMVAENSNANIFTAATEQTYFEIVADINLAYKRWYTNAVTNWLDKPNFENVGFNGIIYGNGHTIYNLYSSASASATGLIPVATQLAEIHDLHIKGGNSIGTYAAGAFIGLARAKERSKAVTLKGCSVENFSAKAANGAGGLIGYVYSQPFNIIDCRVTNTNLTVTAATNSNTAAFVGYLDGSDTGNKFVFENSYCDDINPLVNIKVAFKEETTFKNVYTLNEGYDNSIDGLTKVSSSAITGNNAKDALTDFNFNQMWKMVENGYPVHYSPEEKATFWDGRAAGAFAGGRGTSEEPYLISNASQLYLLASSYDRNLTRGKYYELTNDIAISRVYDNWQDENPYSWVSKKALLDGYTYTDGSFAGVLDGAGYTVSGLYYDAEISDNGTYAYGLIPFVSSKAVIKNLKVENVNINTSGNAYAGAVSGATHVTTGDVNDILNYVNFVNVDVNDVRINQNNANAILGYANRGVKFTSCNGETIATNEEAKIFNFDISVSKDAVVCSNLYSKAEILSAVRQTILGKGKNDICDINGIDGLNIIDLIEVKKTMYLEKPEESLVWSQEFNNSDDVDYSLWFKDTGMTEKTNLKYADNASVSDGKLTLQCKDTGEKVDGNPIYSVNYGLTTLNSMSFKYGRIEMRAKIPFGAGAFPSLWLSSYNALGNAGVENDYGYTTEVDIFEVFGDKGESMEIEPCIHKWYTDGSDKECSCGTGILKGNGYNAVAENRSYTWDSVLLRDEYHTFVFEWTEDTMTFTVDGYTYFTAKKSDMDRLGFNLWDYDTGNEGIFEQHLYLRINNHMHTPGGTSYVYSGDQSKIKPENLNYEIDYIRLYQKNDGKSEIILK